MKSIIQDDITRCFLCGRRDRPLDCHHIFGASNRSKSEKYGLKVYLCHNECHIVGKYSVHQNKEVNDTLKSLGQHFAMMCYGWSVEDFIRIFGKNYVNDDKRRKSDD